VGGAGGSVEPAWPAPTAGMCSRGLSVARLAAAPLLLLLADSSASPLSRGSETLSLGLTRQLPTASSADFGWVARSDAVEWRASETALVLIDLWNCHWCDAMSQVTAPPPSPRTVHRQTPQAPRPPP